MIHEKNKFFLVAIFFIVLIPKNVYASDYINGYFDIFGAPTPLMSYKDYEKIFDNDLSTYRTSAENGNYEANYYDFERHKVKKIYLKVSKVGFYLKDGSKIIKSQSFYSDFEGYIDIDEAYANNLTFYTSVSGSPFKIYEIDVMGDDKTEFLPVSNIDATDVGYEYAKIEYDVPENAQKILINGTDVGRENNYILRNLKSGQKYTVQIDAVYANGKVVSTVFSFTTKKYADPKNVTELKAQADFESVKLSYNYDETVDHVAVYRKKNEFFNNFDTFAKIGETEGKTFEDKNLADDTSYTYLVRSVNKNDVYSDGVSVDVKTEKKPKDEVEKIEPEEPEKQANGDYLFKWTKPEKGNVKVLVGGKEYKIVPALNKQILIPKKDLKYDILGNPDVKLIPVSESGIEGDPVNPNLPNNGGIGGIGGTDFSKDFNPNTLLGNSTGLLWLIGGFVLLGLAFIVAKMYIKTIKKSSQLELQDGGRRWKP